MGRKRKHTTCRKPTNSDPSNGTSNGTQSDEDTLAEETPNCSIHIDLQGDPDDPIPKPPSGDASPPPVQRNAANERERARMRVLSKAFTRLKTSLPWVPPDTKLSKLDTLRLASCYIAHLSQLLAEDDAAEGTAGDTGADQGSVSSSSAVCSHLTGATTTHVHPLSLVSRRTFNLIL